MLPTGAGYNNFAGPGGIIADAGWYTYAGAGGISPLELDGIFAGAGWYNRWAGANLRWPWVENITCRWVT